MKEDKYKKKAFMAEAEKFMKIIKESYIMDSEDMGDFSEEEVADEQEFQEEDGADDIDKINQIRSMALEGIQAYANDVNSEFYQFYKKVWMMCDKICSEQGNYNVGEGK